MSLVLVVISADARFERATLPRRRRCRSAWLNSAARKVSTRSQATAGSDGPAAHAEDVHVIVLDALLRREMVVDERRADARNLVGADRGADAAAADRHAALHLSRDHGLGERNDEVGIVVAGIQSVRAEVDDFMPAARRRASRSSFKPNPP